MAYQTKNFDDEVVRLLKNGAVGFIPSDTIYGLSCGALDRTAVEKIHKLKKRDEGKPLIVLIASIKMLDSLSIDKNQAEIVKKYWPGALSLEFNAPNAPAWLHRGLNHFAIRMPADKSLRELISKVGPIVSTSANLQGEPPIQSVEEAQQLFGEELDFYINVGELDNKPSTLTIVQNGQLKVVREGAVKIEDDREREDDIR